MPLVLLLTYIFTSSLAQLLKCTELIFLEKYKIWIYIIHQTEI